MRHGGLHYQDFSMSAFNQLVSRRPYYMLSLLKDYENVLYSDIDTVWLQDPRPYLKGDYDFFAQLDGVIDGDSYVKGYLPYFCTGFLAMRNTPGTIQLLKNWIFELEKELRQDQTLFNMQVHKLNTNGRPLPMTKFPCGMLYFEEMPESVQNEVVIVHNNFVIGIPKKIQVRLINVCKKVQRQC